jgi:hypothetical protein
MKTTGCWIIFQLYSLQLNRAGIAGHASTMQAEVDC